VCNVFDTDPLEPSREVPLFGSKSIQAPSCPRMPGFTFALNTFALQTVNTGNDTCKLEMLNYFHIGGKFPICLADSVATKVFIQGVVERLRKYLLTHQPAKPAYDEGSPAAMSSNLL
jgi:hypothetical protein